ncbi:MAG: hypothetical protein R3A13_03470 [Bdellovibrionota bacterium]
MDYKVIELIIERGRRYSMPFAYWFSTFSYAASSSRRELKNLGSRPLQSLLVNRCFVLYYEFSLESESHWLNPGAIPIFIALWIPNIVVCAAAIYALKKICSEEWQSVAEALEHVFAVFIKPANRFKKLFEKVGAVS